MSLNLENLIEAMGVTSGILLIYGIIMIVSALAGLVFYILKALGLYRMGKSLNLSNPWISFIPVANIYAFGRIAQRYVRNDGKPSAKLSVWLLVLYIIEIIAATAFIVFAFIALITLTENTSASIINDSAMSISMFSAVIPFIVCYFLLMAVAVIYQIISYVAMWRIYSVFSNNNATLFLVLSVLFNILPPIFIFVISKNEPKLTYSDRMGFEQV